MREWIREVQSTAKQGWDAEPPVSGAVAVTITYFYRSSDPLDVDNIPKPILDALKGLVYADDSQVSDLLCRKRDRNENLLIRNPSANLLASLRDAEPVLHIAMTRAMTSEVLL